MKNASKKHVVSIFAAFCLLLLLSIPVHAKTFEVSVGKEIKLSFPSAFGQSIQWRVKDPSKLSIVTTYSGLVAADNSFRSEYGVILKGVSLGSTEVNAYNTDSGMLLCTATIKIVPAIDFKLKYDTVFLASGQTIQMQALNVPAGTSLIWKSDNRYSTVSSTGLVTCVSPLQVTTVTCSTSDGEYTATCKVIGSIPTNISSRTMTVGSSDKLTYSLNVISNPGSISTKWESNNSNVVTVNSSGEIKALAAGSARVTCKIGNRTLNYIIYVSPAPTATPKPTAPGSQKISISKAKVSGIKAQVYNGKIKKPAPVVSYNGKTLTASKDYVVQYWMNRYPGRAKCAIKGRGNYSGVKYVYFYISPQKQTIRSLTSPRSKAVVVKFKKVYGQNGVQVCYSTDKSFKGAKYTVSGGTSKTLINLQSKKTYYFKIRAYRTVSGKKVYGPYSAVKSIKIK